MTNCLKIVTSWLFNSLVSGNWGISGGTCKVFALFEGNVLSFAILVALGKTKINNVNVISGGVGSSNQEVVGLDITMNDSLLVDFLNTAYELDRNHQHCL